MKVKLRLFASLRETLGESEIDVDMPGSHSVAEFVALLGESKGQQWADVLGADQVLTAVNHTMMADDHILQDGDEVAFFPPVTGG